MELPNRELAPALITEVPREFEQWDDERVFHSGDAFFEGLLPEIASARESIDLEFYIYEDDEIGRALAQYLIEASRRGVRVRAMVDGVGSAGFLARFVPALSAAGVECRIFHPLPWTFLSYPFGRPNALTGWLALFRKINRRNHRKMVIIDRRSAWAGSMNVSRCHLRSLSGKDSWRDTGVRVEGPLVSKLDEAYEFAWQEAWAPQRRRRAAWLARKIRRRIAHRQGELVRLNFNRLLRQVSHREFLRRIVDARSRIWITNPYFVPNTLLIRALGFAAQKGVDVRIIVPRKSDVFFMHQAALAFYGQLLKSGVRIYEYLPRILHAKTYLIDDWVSVGSNNLNHRSLIHDLEVDIGLTHPSSQSSLEHQFLRDLAESQEVTLADWRHAPLRDRLLGWLVLFFKYYL